MLKQVQHDNTYRPSTRSGRTGWLRLLVELRGTLEIVCPRVLTRREFCNVGGKRKARLLRVARNDRNWMVPPHPTPCFGLDGIEPEVDWLHKLRCSSDRFLRTLRTVPHWGEGIERTNGRRVAADIRNRSCWLSRRVMEGSYTSAGCMSFDKLVVNPSTAHFVCASVFAEGYAGQAGQAGRAVLPV